MVSIRHEAIVELIQLCPEFAVEMLTGISDVVVPGYESAEVGSADLSEVVPTERRADAVVTLNDQDGGAVLGSSSRCSWVVTAISRTRGRVT